MCWSEKSGIEVNDSQINPGIDNSADKNSADVDQNFENTFTTDKIFLEKPISKDPWEGRCDGMKCTTCIYYVEKASSSGIKIGRCRRNAPTMKGYPVVYPEDWCGEHKVDEEKLLCG